MYKPDLMLDVINRHRAKAQLYPLSLNKELTSAAQTHAEYLAKTGELSHTGADDSSPFERMTRAGYVWAAAGENIAFGTSDEEMTLELWLNDKPHREIVLTETYIDLGAGVALRDNANKRKNGKYWVIDLAKPLKQG